MRTPEEIKRQMKGLRNMRRRLPAYSDIGTPNHEIIDAQLNIIEGIEDLSDIDEGDWEEMDAQNEVYRGAEEADQWLDGDRDEDLFEEEDAPVEKSETDAHFSVVKVEAVIGVQTEEWKGNCYGIASLCLDKGLVPNGILRYGHYRGPIHKDSMFAKSRGMGFCQHGWIELPDNTVWDPTRWVFENVEPYIYIGKNDHYDVGGNIHRMATRMPAPKFDESAKMIELVAEDAVLNIVKDILRDHRQGNKFTINQVGWIANEDPRTFGNMAKSFYKSLEKCKMDAFVPVDNWRMVME